jgi:hypothetical protein
MGRKAPKTNLGGMLEEERILTPKGIERWEMGIFHNAASIDIGACCWVPKRTRFGGLLTLCDLRNPAGLLVFLFLPPAESRVKYS